MLRVVAIIWASGLTSGSLVAAVIRGRVVAEESGAYVSGATVAVQGTELSARTDLNGEYRIAGVADGVHTLVVTRAGFGPSTISDVAAAGAETISVDVPLRPAVSGDVIELEELSVSAAVVEGSQLGLLSARQRSAALSDAVGADFLGRIDASDAADAMSRMTGASVLDGKYVLIRGLGDRYSNTLLNKISIPSADPDRRAVQMDQFPASLIDSIVTSKSFTADQPGAFSGGSVNIRTRSFPERFFVGLSTSVKFKPDVAGEDTLSIPGGGRDWLGIDDGTRALPGGLPARIPSQSEARLAARNGDFGPAEELDRASKLFHNETYFPRRKQGGLDHGFNFATGNRHSLGDDRVLGYVVSLTYDRATSHYAGGHNARYSQGDTDPTSPTFVDPLLLYSPNLDDYSFRGALLANPELPGGTPPLGVTRTSEQVDWGAFAQVAYRPSLDHELTLRYFHSQSADDSVRRGAGESTRSEGGRLYQIYDFLYTERAIDSLQLTGESVFPSLGGARLEWRAALSESTQEQPDFRTLSYFWDFDSQQYASAAGVGNNRFFRDLEESSDELAADFTLPLLSLPRPVTIKAGALWQDGGRVYRERRFRWSRDATTPEIIAAYPNPVGITGRTATTVEFGNTISELANNLVNYDGDQTVSAAYAMADFLPFEKWRVIAGVRVERTEISTSPASANSTFRAADVDQTDYLPAFSLVYEVAPKMNVRAAYGRTLARPLYRELADVRVEDPFNNEFFAGNPNLEVTTIDNFDLRWEWFPRPNEIFAVSVFHKTFHDPIFVERNSSIGSIQPQNVSEGRVQGIELEGRAGLGALSPHLARFSIGGNFSLIDSEAAIPAEELALIRQTIPDASDRRELHGQSPYIVNIDVTFDQPRWGSSATIAYQVAGERLDLVTSGPLPDVYEQPAPQLDLIVSQRLTRRWKLKLAAKNLLDSDREKTLSANGATYFYERYREGRSFSLGLSYLFE